MKNSSYSGMKYHTPVLLNEAVEGLSVKSGGLYIDATIGGGGHTEEILRLGGRVLGIDQDIDAISHLEKKFESEIKNGNLMLVMGNFDEIYEIADTEKITNVQGILFDLGVSSHQIDDSGRGFSIRLDEPLDMRMSLDSDLTAKEIVNKWSEDALYEIFLKYGEESRSKVVANAIVQARSEKPIETTADLVNVITKVIPRTGDIHPGTRVFQALRIAVNHELISIRAGLEFGFKLLGEDGRMVVISFHSLEDRIVKLFFKEKEREGLGHILTKKPITSSDDEVRNNRRSRSAKMRVFERK